MNNSDYINSFDFESHYKQRFSRILIFFLLIFSFLIIRLFYLQILEGEKLRKLSEDNRIRLQNILAPRGIIHDRNGFFLVDNRPSFDLSIIIKDSNKIEDVIEKLAEYIDMPKKELAAKIDKNRKYSVYKPLLLKKDIGRNPLALIEENKLDLPGVIVTVVPKRHYLYGECAAHLVGYLGEITADELSSGKYQDVKSGDFIGRFGLEKVYENFLRGKNGGRQVEVNANGRVVKTLNTVPAVPGHDIYLTIDFNLQKKAEELLQDKVGSIVAIDPNNGEILAIASMPAFNPNDFVSNMPYEKWKALSTSPFRPMRNKAFQAEYPPGSIYKIITAAAGLEEGVIKKRDTVICMGKYKYGNRMFRCWKKHGHGKVDIEQSIAESCDIFFYEVGYKTGVDKLAYYAKGFGMGSKTGIGLEHEEEGLVPTAAWKEAKTGALWQSGETLSIAIGQSYNLVTPLQMAVMIASVANGGIKYKPLIIKGIYSANGELLDKKQPVKIGKLPISSDTIEIVKRGLFKTVNSDKGTARRISLKRIAISGKTGTAQVIGRKTGDEEEKDEEEKPYEFKSHAWFVGFAPSNNPKIAVSVIVEHGGSGSRAAAPLAKDLIVEYLKDDIK